MEAYIKTPIPGCDKTEAMPDLSRFRKEVA